MKNLLGEREEAEEVLRGAGLDPDAVGDGLAQFAKDTSRDRLLKALEEAEVKGWDSLSRYKFQMFGYWAAIWVHLNRIGQFHRHNPWTRLVFQARQRRSLEEKLAGMTEVIELHVRGGGLVVTLDPEQDPVIYMMKSKPEVIVWNGRIFVRPTDEIIEIDEEGHWHIRYKEVISIPAFTERREP